jgi:hypothetical protein
MNCVSLVTFLIFMRLVFLHWSVAEPLHVAACARSMLVTQPLLTKVLTGVTGESSAAQYLVDIAALLCLVCNQHNRCLHNVHPGLKPFPVGLDALLSEQVLSWVIFLHSQLPTWQQQLSQCLGGTTMLVPTPCVGPSSSHSSTMP